MSTQPVQTQAQMDSETKDMYHETARELGESGSSSDEAIYHSTNNDVRDMQRMGKPQQLRRNFRRISSISFVCVLCGTWEFILIANSQALTDGGRAGLFWTFILASVGMLMVMASLAEMASMAPTSGGQYHWVSEFAPLKYQRFLSYISGWLSALSWQALSSSSGLLVAGMIQSLILVYNPNYDALPWQLFLIAVGVLLVINVFNVYAAQWLATIQNTLMMLHIFTLVTVVIILWTLAPHPPAKEVLLTFVDEGGFPSIGLSLCVGQISSLYALSGGDCAAHISEEVKDAGINVPRSMFWGFFINILLALVLVISYIFAIENLDAALNDPTGFPFLYVFQECLPTGGTAALTIIILIIIMASNISSNASTARQAFAFARDRGLPFSDFIGKVHPTLKIPANAVWTTLIISIASNLIILGSSAAFNALVSLSVVGLMATYTLSISVMLWRRLALPDTLPRCYWSLGRWGPFVNVIAIAYASFSLFFAFWPMTYGWDLGAFNWSPVMFVGVVVLSMVVYVVRGRKVYFGPIVTVEGFLAERRLEGFTTTKESESVPR